MAPPDVRGVGARGELAAAAGLTTFALWQLHTAYTDHAPDFETLRHATPGDPDVRQALLDADLSVGSFALLAGLVASLIARSWLPLAVIVAGFGLLTVEHHLLLRGAPAA